MLAHPDERERCPCGDTLGPCAAAAAPGTLFRGTGGELLVEQVKAAGTRYIFTNPGSLEVASFDALIDRPELELVAGLHEGIVIPSRDEGHRRAPLRERRVDRRPVVLAATGR